MDYVTVTTESGETIDVLPKAWMKESDIAEEAAKCDFDGSGTDLVDPSEWPRRYTVNGKAFSVYLEYNPDFTAIQLEG